MPACIGNLTNLLSFEISKNGTQTHPKPLAGESAVQNAGGDRQSDPAPFGRHLGERVPGEPFTPKQDTRSLKTRNLKPGRGKPYTPKLIKLETRDTIIKL